MITSPPRAARRAVAAVVAAGALCAAAPLAAALDTTIRVEGSADTLIPESAISIEADGTRADLWDSVGTPVQVDRGSGFWQVYRAASAASLDFGFRDFGFGLGVETIGPDTAGGLVGWQYKVNNVSAMVGAESTQLAQGDSVLWFYGGYAGARNLDVVPSSDQLPQGASFTVNVVSYDENGTPTPAAGANVAYGAAQGTADAGGNVTFIAQGNGVQGVRAVRAGDVRSATRGVCSFDQDPTVCNLPPTPPAPAPTPPTGELPDTVPPGSTIRDPELRSVRAAVRSITGTAGPDRSDVAKVEVAVGLRVGTLCRYRTAAGALTPARDCARPEWIPARNAGGNWVLPLGPRGLTAGTWRVESRATDGAGNVETVRVPGVNIGAFRVRGPVVAPVTRITAPRAGARLANVRALRGTAGPAAADVALVQVSLARRVAAGCRFVTARGGLTGVRSCTARVFLPARSRGASWTLSLPAPLARGQWVAVARSRSAEGTLGRPASVVFTATRAAR